MLDVQSNSDSNEVPHHTHETEQQSSDDVRVPSSFLDDEMDEDLLDEMEADEFNAEMEREPELEREHANEPPFPVPVHDTVEDDSSQHQHVGAHPTTPLINIRESRTEAERRLRVRPHVVKYPNHAGQPVRPISEKPALNDQERYLNSLGASLGDHTNSYAPFKSRMDWEIAQWAKMRGPSSSAFTDLMGIDGVRFFLDCMHSI